MRWYWVIQDYGPERYVPVRFWQLLLIVTTVVFLGFYTYAILRMGE